MKDDDARYPKTIARWKAQPGDPNRKPMTLAEAIAQMKANEDESQVHLRANRSALRARVQQRDGALST